MRFLRWHDNAAMQGSSQKVRPFSRQSLFFVGSLFSWQSLLLLIANHPDNDNTPTIPTPCSQILFHHWSWYYGFKNQNSQRRHRALHPQPSWLECNELCEFADLCHYMLSFITIIPCAIITNNLCHGNHHNLCHYHLSQWSKSTLYLCLSTYNLPWGTGSMVIA